MDRSKADLNKATLKQQPVTDGSVQIAMHPVPIAQPHKVDNLIDIIYNNPKIVYRNDSNNLEVNGHAVPGSNFDQLYAAVLSPKQLQHIAGMTELLGALKQLNVKSKTIVSNLIKATYKSGAARLGQLS